MSRRVVCRVCARARRVRRRIRATWKGVFRPTRFRYRVRMRVLRSVPVTSASPTRRTLRMAYAVGSKCFRSSLLGRSRCVFGSEVSDVLVAWACFPGQYRGRFGSSCRTCIVRNAERRLRSWMRGSMGGDKRSSVPSLRRPEVLCLFSRRRRTRRLSRRNVFLPTIHRCRSALVCPGGRIVFGLLFCPACCR